MVVIPLFLLLCVVVTFTTVSYRKNTALTSQSFIQAIKSTESCSVDSCPSELSETPCSVKEGTVMGGLDFVQYFTDFKLSDGTYNESMYGSRGDDDIYSMYKSFKFLFLSEGNKAIFDEEPSKYAPQYGGFCSWGISGEFCPQYPWSSSCLGPSGNWEYWTIYDEKLYFFLKDTPKQKFLANPMSYSEAGEERWSGWFEDDDHFSTECYISPDNQSLVPDD